MVSTEEGGRFVLECLNFGMTAAFTVALTNNAFNMENIKGPQVFRADRVVQSNETLSDSELAILGLFQTVSKTTTDSVPIMYDSQENSSMLRLDAMHCNFMLLSALWIASAFSLASIQFPWEDKHYFSSKRAIVVHLWNFLGLIVTSVVFTSTTRWSGVPISNLFYSLVFQCLGWVYQYFYMVECTKIFVTCTGNKFGVTTEMRHRIYTEFSVVIPLLLVSAMMPGAQGIDAWRVQTVLFSSWVLFTLLDLQLRYRKIIEPVAIVHNPHINGMDGLGYLTYAIVLVYVMNLNALGASTFYVAPYHTHSVKLCRIGVWIIVLVTSCIILETLIKVLTLRFLDQEDQLNYKNRKAADSTVDKSVVDYVTSFVCNALIICVGSFVVKAIIFVGVSDVNGLSSI